MSGTNIKSISNIGGVKPPYFSTPITVIGQNFPSGIKNSYMDQTTQVQYVFSQNETPYRSNMTCETGIPTVNNDCICPNDPSAVPFRNQVISTNVPTYMNTLFQPLEPSMFPKLSPAAQLLLDQRKPVNYGYTDLDTTKLTQN